MGAWESAFLVKLPATLTRRGGPGAQRCSASPDKPPCSSLSPRGQPLRRRPGTGPRTASFITGPLGTQLPREEHRSQTPCPRPSLRLPTHRTPLPGPPTGLVLKAKSTGRTASLPGCRGCWESWGRKGQGRKGISREQGGPVRPCD